MTKSSAHSRYIRNDKDHKRNTDNCEELPILLQRWIKSGVKFNKELPKRQATLQKKNETPLGEPTPITINVVSADSNKEHNIIDRLQ